MEVWRGAEMGLRVIIVNPSVILGPGRWNSGSGQLFTRISKGMPFYTNGVTGYVDVRDVVKAMVLLTENQSISNERFILNSQNISYQEAFSLIATSIGKKAPRYQMKPWLVDIFYPLASLLGFLIGKGAVISRENLNSAFKKTVYSADKINQTIGFQFIPISESIDFIGKIYCKGL